MTIRTKTRARYDSNPKIDADKAAQQLRELEPDAVILSSTITEEAQAQYFAGVFAEVDFAIELEQMERDNLVSTGAERDGEDTGISQDVIF